MQIRVTEVIERNTRRLNVVVLEIEDSDEERDKTETKRVTDSLVDEANLKIEVLGWIGEKERRQDRLGLI